MIRSQLEFQYSESKCTMKNIPVRTLDQRRIEPVAALFLVLGLVPSVDADAFPATTAAVGKFGALAVPEYFELLGLILDLAITRDETGRCKR
jgi:hypothetical protein